MGSLPAGFSSLPLHLGRRVAPIVLRSPADRHGVCTSSRTTTCGCCVTQEGGDGGFPAHASAHLLHHCTCTRVAVGMPTRLFTSCCLDVSLPITFCHGTPRVSIRWWFFSRSARVPAFVHSPGSCACAYLPRYAVVSVLLLLHCACNI